MNSRSRWGSWLELIYAFAERGEWLATVVSDALDGAEHHLARFRTYDRDGVVQWEYESSEWEASALRVADDGRISARVSEVDPDGDTVRSIVVDELGVADVHIGGFLGPVAADDWIPATGGDGGRYFHNITTNASMDASYWPWPEGAEEYGEFRDDGYLVYVAEVDGVWGWVEERPGDFGLTPWPEFAVYADEWNRDYSLIGRWGLFGPDYHLIRLQGGVSEGWDLAPPPGQYEHPCGSPSPRFDAGGEPIVLWRDDDSERAWVKPSPDEDWAPVPDLHPIAAHIRAELSAYAGTYVLTARGQGEVGCSFGMPVWAEPPAEAVRGSSTQIVRPSADSKLIIQPSTRVYVAGQGRCGVRPVSDDPDAAWRFDDFESQTWFEAPIPGEIRWLGGY